MALGLAVAHLPGFTDLGFVKQEAPCAMEYGCVDYGGQLPAATHSF